MNVALDVNSSNAADVPLRQAQEQVDTRTGHLADLEANGTRHRKLPLNVL